MPPLRSRELPSAGSHAAVCYLLANLGTQRTKFGPKEQLCFGFELLDQHRADGTPFTIVSLPYTISSEPKASLRQDMESWFGRIFTSDDFGELDLEERVGATALLGIKHVLSNGKEYANITSIMPPPAGAPLRRLPIRPTVIFNFEEKFEAYDDLPRFVQNMIASTQQYQGRMNPGAVPALTTHPVGPGPILPGAAAAVLAENTLAEEDSSEEAGTSLDDEIDDDIPF
jgi:hypothetical protein